MGAFSACAADEVAPQGNSSVEWFGFGVWGYGNGFGHSDSPSEVYVHENHSRNKTDLLKPTQHTLLLATIIKDFHRLRNLTKSKLGSSTPKTKLHDTPITPKT